jgi:hypothetical protein
MGDWDWRSAVTEPGSPGGDRIAFASTLYDPHDRLREKFRPVADLLRHFRSISIACTEHTSDRLTTALEQVGAQTIRALGGSIGTSRRAALTAAMDSSPDWVLYCDFDRWVHWAIHFPAELENLPSKLAQPQRGADPCYVCVGRSERAFKTHPETQQIPESATNRAISLQFGQPLDAVAGACWMNTQAARLILRDSREPSAATDLEWPALINRSCTGRVASIETEGLEFETATFYETEIAQAGGRDAWIRATYDRTDVWADRLRLAADSVAALVRVGSLPTDCKLVATEVDQ